MTEKIVDYGIMFGFLMIATILAYDFLPIFYEHPPIYGTSHIPYCGRLMKAYGVVGNNDLEFTVCAENEAQIIEAIQSFVLYEPDQYWCLIKGFGTQYRFKKVNAYSEVDGNGRQRQ